MKTSTKSNSAVCITGAHRSGTSMLTRLLHASGLELGSAADLMPAQADNPEGFWEHLHFVEINDEVLTALGGAWDLPPQTKTFEEPRLDPLRIKATALVTTFEEHTLWGWKDPRNSLTLPFWREILPALRTVVVVRNPLEVAHSLKKRNGSSHAFGLRLWEIYNRRILETTTPEDRLITLYDSFFEDAKAELGRVGAFIGFSPTQVAGTTSLVARDQRHTHFTLAQLRKAGVSAGVVELYCRLAAEAIDNAEKPHPSHGSQVHLTENQLLPGAVSRVIPEFPERLLEHRDAVLDDLSRSLAISEQGRQQAEGENRNLRERFTQTNQLLHLKSVALQQAEEHSVGLAQNLREHLKANKKLLHFLREVALAAQRLQQSRRWKIVNAISWLKASLAANPTPGFGHLDRAIEKFTVWRSKHPELENVDSAIHALDSRSPAQGASVQSFGKPPPPWEEIRFASADDVEISIIIPVFNQLAFTQTCLASLQQHAANTSFEVIVIDDCSTDRSKEILSEVPGLVYLRNEINKGFISSSNRGAVKARGRFLVFLNNDTVVTRGWLTALRETFDCEEEVGLVGSKLVYPDGRLQEAGGIIWRDASGWNRGKFQDADKPEYNFLREVDYCSAACVMIPKDLFDSLGGFDSAYAPAYYEDTDLAFKVAKSGHKVFYQPLSVVIHYEGITGGIDIAGGTKKYQELNRETFARIWSDRLALKPANGDIEAWNKLRAGQLRILAIDHHVPLVDRDSGSLRMFQILTLLRRLGHRITFLPDNLADIPPYGDNLRKHGIEVLHHPYITSVREYLQEAGDRFDVVVLSRRDFASKHIASVRLHAPRARLIFDTVDLHFLREEREADLTQDEKLKGEIEKKRRLEYDLIDAADQTWVVSPAEKDLLQRERPDKSFEVVSNIVPVPGSATPFAQRRDLLFIGSFQHTPNIDAVVFFTREIFPTVRERLGDVKFYIIGEKAPPEVIALADEFVVVTGFQPDVSAFFNSVRLSVAPLRYGAGVKGKINQSMGFGVPVIATSLAIEGMSLVDREDIYTADGPVEFANGLVEVYQSETIWSNLSRNGVEKTKSFYSAQVAEKQLARLFRDVRGGTDQPTRAAQAHASVGGIIQNGA